VTQCVIEPQKCACQNA